MLPFRLEGETYLSCTTRSLSNPGQVILPPRCPTKVDNRTLEASREGRDWGKIGGTNSEGKDGGNNPRKNIEIFLSGLNG